MRRKKRGQAATARTDRPGPGSAPPALPRRLQVRDSGNENELGPKTGIEMPRKRKSVIVAPPRLCWCSVVRVQG